MCFDVDYVTVSVLSCSINYKLYQFDRTAFRNRNQISFFFHFYMIGTVICQTIIETYYERKYTYNLTI